MWAATREFGLEGRCLAKDPRSAWVPRRTKRWLKCKHWRHATFPVMGWAASTDKEPAGLVVGAPGAIGELHVIGVAPIHVDREARDVVMRMVDELRPDRVPLLAPRWRRPVLSVDDGLVADVRYLERTPTGLLRDASVWAVGSLASRS